MRCVNYTGHFHSFELRQCSTVSPCTLICAWVKIQTVATKTVKRERRWRVAEKMRESALVWTGTAVTLGTCSWSFDFPISVFLSVVQGGCETRGSDCVWGAKSPPSRTSYKEPIREIGTPCCHKHCLMSVCHFITISVYLPICLLDKGGSISFFLRVLRVWTF